MGGGGSRQRGAVEGQVHRQRGGDGLPGLGGNRAVEGSLVDAGLGDDNVRAARGVGHGAAHSQSGGGKVDGRARRGSLGGVVRGRQHVGGIRAGGTRCAGSAGGARGTGGGSYLSATFYEKNKGLCGFPAAIILFNKFHYPK